MSKQSGLHKTPMSRKRTLYQNNQKRTLPIGDIYGDEELLTCEWDRPPSLFHATKRVLLGRIKPGSK